MGRYSVIEIIANGDRGFPYDSVIQIGYVDVDTETGELSDGDIITIKSDADSWSQKERDYVGDSVSEEDLRNGTELAAAVERVKSDLKGKDATSFEIANTFGRYLSFEPWDLTFETSILPSISFRLPSTVRGMDSSKENVYIERAYSRYLRDDPLGLGNRRRDALDYARESAMLLLFLRDRGLY